MTDNTSPEGAAVSIVTAIVMALVAVVVGAIIMMFGMNLYNKRKERKENGGK